jgi:hypothetical protein
MRCCAAAVKDAVIASRVDEEELKPPEAICSQRSYVEGKLLDVATTSVGIHPPD